MLAQADQVVDLDDQLAELLALRDAGKIGALGLSNVSADQLRRALPAGAACVQNAYNLLDRGAEEQLGVCREHGIAWVPFFPLGSAFPGAAKVPDRTEVRAAATVRHLEDNAAAGDVVLDPATLAELDALAG